MNKIRILFYGDSNTWGAFFPGTNRRFDRNENRYTRLLQNSLGDGYEIIEEGCIGRTTGSDYVTYPKGNRNGMSYFVQCVYSHDPLDYIGIMLGTNDMKAMHEKTPEDVAKILEEKYINFVRGDLSSELINVPKIIIITPPIIKSEKEKYEGAAGKSLSFKEAYRALAERNNCLFVDNDGVGVGVDGVHLSTEGHRILASKIEKVLMEDLSRPK